MEVPFTFSSGKESFSVLGIHQSPLDNVPTHFGKEESTREACLIHALNHLIKIRYFWSPRQFLSAWSKLVDTSLDDLEAAMIKEKGVKVNQDVYEPLFFFKLKAQVFGIRMLKHLTTNGIIDMKLDTTINKW